MLTIKQRDFIKVYLETGNGTEAAMQAYKTHSRKMANSMSKELRRKPHIQKAIKKALEAQGLTTARLAQNLARLASAEVERVSADVKLRACIEMFKLQGIYPK